MRRAIVLSIVAAAVLAGCGTSDPTTGPKATLPGNVTTTVSDTGGTTGADDETTTALALTTTTEKAATGSKADPLTVNQGATVGEWDVTVTQIIRDATAEIKGGNDFNDDPTKGVYMKVALAATYRGDTEGSPDASLLVALSGSDAVQYKDYDCNATFGESDFPTLEPGGTTILGVCIDAPASAIAGGTVFVEDQGSFDDGNRAYWAIPA